LTILIQIENEYGSYGSDKKYLAALVQKWRQHLGPDVIIHSTDGPTELMLSGTALPEFGVYQTVDFGPGSDPVQQFAVQRTYQPTAPLMNSEYYTGWLTHWGDSSMAHTDDVTVAKWLDLILSTGNASVNMYMFVGGTNWAFMNGANADSAFSLAASVTSYDYDSPISENGDLTSKYYAVQKVIAHHTGLPLPQGITTVPSRRSSYGPVKMDGYARLFDVLDEIAVQTISSPTTLTFEQLGQAFGFVLYRTHLPSKVASLQIQDVHDRALVFVDETYVGVLQRNSSMPDTLSITAATGDAQLDVLVENLGRINYGRFLHDAAAGITEGILCDYQFLSNYTIFGLPLTSVRRSSLSAWQAPSIPCTGLSFFVGNLSITGTPTDTYVTVAGWTKGVVFINGVNIGRYWEPMGPQHWLYVPAPILTSGVNDVVLFELEGTSSLSVVFQDTPAGLKWDHR